MKTHARMTEWKDRNGVVHPRLEGEGVDLSAAFRAAAYAFFDSFTDVTAVRPEAAVVIFCESSDSDWLFSDWINTLIYEVRERGMVFSEFHVEVDGINVKGEIRGERIDPARHFLRREQLAGAAFDELFAVEETRDGKSHARVSAVLNDFARHPLPLREIWERGRSGEFKR